MAGDDVVITIRAHNGDAVRAFRDTEGRLRDMRGRFVTEGAVMTGSMNRLSAAIGGVRGSIIPLASAAAPLAAALAPIAVKAAGAGVAVAAFGAAVAGQVSHLSDASKAQDTYSDAVLKYGRGSKQAAEAQHMLSATLSSMPQATARAAISMQTLKGEFQEFSDESAQFTMVPVEKSFTVLGQVIPKLTPMAKGAAAELDRLVTVAGGAVASPGFDALADKVSTFANESLKSAVDGAIHFARALSEGDASGPIKSFVEYAEANGPALRETLGNISNAVSTLVEAAANAGPGMLTLVNAAAQLVASLPPELVATLMQVAVGLKVVTLAGAAAAAVSGGIQTLGTRIAGLQAASAAAGGGLAGLRAAFLSLGTAAKASIIVGGLALVALGIGKLAEKARGAPPDVDKLATSLKGLASSGKFSGELRETFGDMDGLVGKIKLLRQETDSMKESALGFRIPVLDDIAEWAAGPLSDITKGDKSLNALKDDFEGLDKGMATLVSNGYAKEAAQDFEAIKAAALAQGHSLQEVTALFPEYSSAVEDAKFEQDLAVQSMGIFGAAAQDTSAKLDAQKGAADGLRASILALNDTNRSAYDAQIGYEQSLDDLTASFKEHGATLNLNTEDGRANAQAMSQVAAAHDEMLATGVAAGESLGSMTQKSEGLRETMMRLATEAFGGNKQAAEEYVNTLLGVPSQITTMITAEKEQAVTGLQEVRTAIQATPGAKSVTVSTLNAAAIAALEAVGYKTRQLPDGRTEVTTANGKAIGSISAVSTAMNNIDGTTATTYINTVAYQTFRQGERDFTNNNAHGGRVPRYAVGDQVQFAPNGLLSGPGSGTSDDILALFASGAVGRVSDTEYVVNARSTKKYLPLLEAINRDQIKGYAKGGGVAGAARGARDEIRAATSGSTERRLLALMNAISGGHMKMATALSKVSAELTKAKDSLSSLRTAASQLSGSVKSGVLSAANITGGARGDGPVTLQSIMSGLVASRDKATAFSGALKGLQAKGLRSDLIRQIAEAGIEGGGLETAGALLSASSSEIGSVNQLQSQIVSAAKSAGQTTANAVYGATIKAQQKLVTALDTLTKTLKTATGKKAAGGIVGMAASGGIRSNLTWVGEQGPELLDLPAGSRVWSNPDSQRMAAAPWASMLNTPRRAPVSAVPAAAGVGSEQPIVIQVRIGDKEFGELWVETGRRKVKAIGSIEATLKPSRGR